MTHVEVVQFTADLPADTKMGEELNIMAGVEEQLTSDQLVDQIEIQTQIVTSAQEFTARDNNFMFLQKLTR